MDEEPGKGSVNNLRTLVEDDDNDSLLFERLQQSALKNYPNPARIGCPDYATLKAFVEAPRTVDLEALKDIHIMKCAECTRDLIELRRLRDERRAKEAAIPSSWLASSVWKSAAIAVSLCAIVIIGMNWRNLISRASKQNEVATAVSVTADLSGDGVSRSTEAPKEEPAVTLPQKRVQLHMILPFFSPAGDYRVTITRDKGLGNVQAQGRGSATAQGPKTELTVDLDLRRLSAGKYYLGAERIGDGGPYFYPVIIT
jgi:hypothetical protein